MADKTSFLEATKVRRSLYALSKESPISNDRILSIVEHAIRYTPSPFNARSCRCIVLFGDHHDKLWDMGAAAIQRCMPMAVDVLIPKVQGFRAGYGTVRSLEYPSVRRWTDKSAPGHVL
jgi:predicted oxidoreductase (fatty acid repression mutant protein)